MVKVGPGSVVVTVTTVVYNSSVPLTVVVTTVVCVTVVSELVSVVVCVLLGPVVVVVVVSVVVDVVIKPRGPSATAVTEAIPKVVRSTARVKMSILKPNIPLRTSLTPQDKACGKTCFIDY